jgi:hypothetical protein
MNFDPIHWLCVALVLVSVSLGIYTKIISAELDACRSSIKAVEVVGDAQEKETKKDNKESKETKDEVDKVYVDTITKLRSDNNRLRDEVARSRQLPPAPQVCTGGGETTTINWPEVERAIDQYRNRVRDIVEEGDQDREGLNAVRKWVAKKDIEG